MTVTDDERFMHAALAYGRRGLGYAGPNPSVGCLIVKEGRIVGRGVTQPGGRPHGEVMALDQAGDEAQGSTVYVTLEPCSHYGHTPPCVDALARAGVARVVACVADPDPRVRGTGFVMLETYGLRVTPGVLELEGYRAHRGHFTRMALGRPAVTVKMALSRDLRVAGPGGRPVRITGPEAYARVHMMRAMSDAVLIGIGTALGDDPLLTVRLPGLVARSPVRVVLDSGLRLSPSCRLVATARDVPLWIVAAADASMKAEAALVAQGATILRLARPGRVDLGDALRLIGARGITRCLVEPGPTLAAALIRADLVDEAVLFTAPDPIGDGPLAFSTDTAARLDAVLPLLEARPVGHDLMTTRRRS